MKNIITIFLIAINSIAFGQIVPLEDIELLQTTISKTYTTKVKILGKKITGNVNELKSTVNVQVSCRLIYAGEWEDKENEYIITIVKDSNCVFLNLMYKRISRYWKKQERWSDKYNANGDFTHLTVRDGLYKIDNNIIIPMIRTESQIEGIAFLMFWYNYRLYKIDLIKSGGFGGISSFVKQNLQIKKGDKTYKLLDLVRKLDETKKLIKEMRKRS